MSVHYNTPQRYQSCCLGHIGVNFSIDIIAEAIPEKIIERYEVIWSNSCRPYIDFFGNKVTESYHACMVEQVIILNGKYAYPVYDITHFGDEGYQKLAGWCIKDTDQFAGYERR